MFYVVCCPNCVKYQITSSSKQFKCKFCGKTKKLSLLKIFFSSPDAPVATQALQELKEKKAMKKDRAQGDFFSYNP